MRRKAFKDLVAVFNLKIPKISSKSANGEDFSDLKDMCARMLLENPKKRPLSVEIEAEARLIVENGKKPSKSQIEAEAKKLPNYPTSAAVLEKQNSSRNTNRPKSTKCNYPISYLKHFKQSNKTIVFEILFILNE